MSSTRKSKPPDRGAPDHKPSRKVALNEVLRSLQDLVQNELNVESGSAQSSAAANPVAPMSPPPVAPTAPHSTSLDNARPDTAPEDSSPPAGLGETPAPATRPKTKTKNAAPSLSDKTRRRPAAGGVQQELPYLDSDSSETTIAAETSVIDAVSTAPAENSPETSEVQDLEVTDVAPATEPATVLELPESNITIAPHLDPDNLPELTAGNDTVSTEIHAAADENPDRAAWTMGDDDLGEIPVLEDAVDLSEAMTTPAHRPTPTEARRLAIQAAARLNVALRKEGKPVLASDVIARLVRELEQVLANDPPNVDNTRPKQH